MFEGLARSFSTKVGSFDFFLQCADSDGAFFLISHHFLSVFLFFVKNCTHSSIINYPYVAMCMYVWPPKRKSTLVSQVF